MTNVKVVGGDITQEPSDALITAIGPNGKWFDGVNASILETSGFMFHLQTVENKPLVDGQTVYALPRGYHEGKFNSVLFVIDDHKQPLYNIVMIALREAERLKLRRVTLPTIRTGGASGISPSRRVAIEALARAAKDIAAEGLKYVEEITIVVYDNFYDVKCIHEVLD